MKLCLLLLTFFSVNAFAQSNCTYSVESTCLDSISAVESKVIEDFLFDEKTIADFFEMSHVSQIKVFKAKSLNKLSKNGVDSKTLKSFISFATKELGVYTSDEEIDVIEAFKGGEFFESKEDFKAYFTKLALDQEEVDATVYSGCDVPFDSIMYEVRSRKASLEKLLNFLTAGENTKFAVYALADNNNENTQDAQYMIASGDLLILVNQFWFL